MRSVHTLNTYNDGHHIPPPPPFPINDGVEVESGESPLPENEQECDVKNVGHESFHATSNRPRLNGTDIISSRTRPIDYARVRTNWSTFPEGSTCQSVMVSKAQVIGGVLTIPKERCRRIFGIVGDFNVLEETTKLEEDEEEVDGSLLIPVQEVGLHMDGAVSTTHRMKARPGESSVVVWSFLDSSRGYLVKMKNYPSQPTQVYLHGLDMLFQEMSVTPWSVLCFAPLGVVGHCQMSVWPSDHPQFASFCSSVTYGWSQGLEAARMKRNDPDQQGGIDVVQEHHGNESVVGETTFRPEALMIKTVLVPRLNMYSAVVVQGKFVASQAEGPTKVRVVAPMSAHHFPHVLQKKNKKVNGTKSLEVKTNNKNKRKKKRRGDRRAHSENDGGKDDTENTGNDSAMLLGQEASHGKSVTGRNLRSSRSRPFGSHQPSGDVMPSGGGDAGVDIRERGALSERCGIGNAFGITSLRRRTRKANPHQGHSM